MPVFNLKHPVTGYKRLPSLFFIFLFLSSPASAEIKKIWEIDLTKIFNPKIEGSLSPDYAPVYNEGKLIFGSNRGVVKVMDVETQKISFLTTIPIQVQTVGNYGKNIVIFYGLHRSHKTPIYAAVDIVKKRVTGFMEVNGPIWKIDDWAVFEQEKRFLIFNPKAGRVAYSQAADKQMLFPVYSPEGRKFFLSAAHELMEVSMPKLAAGFIFSRPSQAKLVKEISPLLEFSYLRKLPEDFIPDTITDENLYFHKKTGAIGRLDLITNSLVWERTFLKGSSLILGPIAYKNFLYYLVSYPDSAKSEEKRGKIISLNKKNGMPNWLSKDLIFQNFFPVQFRNFIVSGDTEGHIVFLNLKTGSVMQKFPVEGALTQPVAFGNSLYIHAGEKIFYFKFSHSRFAVLPKIIDIIQGIK